MAPPRGHHGGNSGGGGAVTRDRVIVVLFLGLMVGLGFGLASLQVPHRNLVGYDCACVERLSPGHSASLHGALRNLGKLVVCFHCTHA
jgi:hypothetical protein